MTTLAQLSAPPEQARQFRERGWWRDETFLDDLARWARVRPDGPAIIAGRADEVGQVSYAELDRQVKRFASGLSALGVGPGDVVAVQLPDWWETAALLLACMRAGAIAQPMLPDLRPREAERVLACTGAKVCVVPDRWGDQEHAKALAEMAPRLPKLQHRVVYGAAVPDVAATGALDFRECFLRAAQDPDEQAWPELDPDRVCLVLFTSGTTGEAKAVLHTFNTLYAGTSGFTAEAVKPAMDQDYDRAAITPKITHIAGPLWALFGTLLTGGAGVFQDNPDPDQLLDLMERVGATRLLVTANRLFGLIEAQLRRPRQLDKLHTIAAGGSPVPPSVVPTIQQVFGVRLRSVWGMTEVVVGSIVGTDDPSGWSAHSDGRPIPGLEMDVRSPDGSGGTGELLVRGASLCLGTMTRDAGEISLTGDGWFATGDLARPDGRGGIRIVGRVGDRVIGKTALMIPVRDVEDELLRHPKVADVAIVAVGEGHLEEVCAVVVPAPDQASPTLLELNDHLHDCGMTDWYRPDRLELVQALPRDHLGKIRKYQLRQRFDPARLGAGADRAPSTS